MSVSVRYLAMTWYTRSINDDTQRSLHIQKGVSSLFPQLKPKTHAACANIHHPGRRGPEHPVSVGAKKKAKRERKGSGMNTGVLFWKLATPKT